MALLYDELERLVVAAQRCKGKLESLDEKPNLQNEIGRLLEMLYAELGLLEVNVVYLSGDPVTKPVLLHPEEKLGEVYRSTWNSTGRRCRLVSSTGRMCSAESSVAECFSPGTTAGIVLTAVPCKLEIYSSIDSLAFVAVKSDGSVIAWGDAESGGDTSAVQGQLAGGVRHVFCGDDAFAALKADGAVVTWGVPGSGGGFGAVKERFAGDVARVTCNGDAFAASKFDGSVVTWGDTKFGGDSSTVQERLAGGVRRVTGSGGAFAAVKSDGSVIAWGCPRGRGDANTFGESDSPKMWCARPATTARSLR